MIIAKGKEGLYTFTFSLNYGLSFSSSFSLGFYSDQIQRPVLRIINIKAITVQM